MKRLAALALLLVLAPPAAGKADDSILIKTPRGATVAVTPAFPPGAGPFPTVVLGPGTGTMKQSINEAVAEALVAHGFAVFRFEWAYYLADKTASPSDTNRAPEIEDFTTVVALARTVPRVDAANIVVGGKSRGTIIAWRVLANDPAIKGILQLTPVCTKDGFTVDDLYPGFASETRPSLWLSGDVDPACATKTLYAFLAPAGARARAGILRGDHGLAQPATAELAGALAADFVSQVAGQATR